MCGYRRRSHIAPVPTTPMFTLVLNLVMTTQTTDGLDGRILLIFLWETVGVSAENNYEIVLAMYIWQKTQTMSFLSGLGVDVLRCSSLWYSADVRHWRELFPVLAGHAESSSVVAAEACRLGVDPYGFFRADFFSLSLSR